jgi:hypothetical protein
MGMPAARSYERNYAHILADVVGWSDVALTIALEALMSRADKIEGTWGAIDALADLLGGIERPA